MFNKYLTKKAKNTQGWKSLQQKVLGKLHNDMQKKKKEEERKKRKQRKLNWTPILPWGFPGITSGKEPACQCRRQERQFWSLGQEDPLEEEMYFSTPVFLPGESHKQKSLVGYSPQGNKESDTTEVI